jgi:hypothetical protein
MPESHEEYCRLARNLDEEQLLELDSQYREKCGTSVDWQLHGIVMHEIHRRRELQRQRLERALWLATRRGRFFEAIKRWLISRGLWSSAAREPRRPRSLIGRLVVLLWQSDRGRRGLVINTLPGRQTPLEQL